MSGFTEKTTYTHRKHICQETTQLNSLSTCLFALTLTDLNVFIQCYLDNGSSNQKTFHLYLTMQLTVQHTTLTTITTADFLHADAHLTNR